MWVPVFVMVLRSDAEIRDVTRHGYPEARASAEAGSKRKGTRVDAHR